jgi:hypothetical protein
MKMLSAQKKWLCVDDTGSADLVRFRRGVVETRCAMRDARCAMGVDEMRGSWSLDM